MNKKTEIKEKICNQLKHILDAKLNEALKIREATKESRDNETKSSSGDKHETGRAMMQIEMEKNEVQLSKAMNLKNELARINIQKKYNKVEFGSLVITNQETYFFSIGIGKLTIDDEDYYAISLASPVGQLLKDKMVGDKARLEGREFVIKAIL